MSKGGANMNRTEYLFARPSFVKGVGKILDIGATSKALNTSFTPEEADFNAILSDWEMTGDYMREALEEYGQQTKTKF
jgi:hypothetical protein